MKPQGGDAVQQQINSLNGIYSIDIGMELLDVLIGFGKDYLISNEPSSLANSASTTGTSNGSISKMGGYNDIYNLSHELFHAFQYENGQGGATIYNEVEAYIFSQCLSDTYIGVCFFYYYQLSTISIGAECGFPCLRCTQGRLGRV